VVITLSHDNRESSNTLYAGKNEDSLYPVDEEVLKSIFGTDLKLNHVTLEMFVNNLAVFFENEGRQLITGNVYVLDAIERFIYKESAIHTSQLIDKQSLDAADKAWEEGNYKDFIKYLDKIGRERLPLSYDLKYKMAREK